MTKFNPDFWEVTLASESWERIPAEDGLWHESPDETKARHRATRQARAVWPRVRQLMEEVLSERQMEVVLLYYLDELNQREIAERLGVTQQAISEHLHGKIRNGRAVGGALRKLRRACLERGIRWE